ncbi:MAG: hypothetical protein AAFX96_01775, partial [Pseudomonadota bacterium]
LRSAELGTAPDRVGDVVLNVIRRNELSIGGVEVDDHWIRPGRIDATVKKGKRRVVRLEEKIPVHIAYLTSWVNKDGSIHFRRDVYERDTILAKALKRSRS